MTTFEGVREDLQSGEARRARAHLARRGTRLGSVSLRRAYRVGLGLLALQFCGFAIWSEIAASRGALTRDAALFIQSWYLIAHGVLDPFSSVSGAAFWHDHAAFLFWLTAPLWYAWPHPVTLLWLQDLAVVGAEAVALRWTCELLEQRKIAHASQLVIFAVVVVVANPWLFWSIAWDVHVEAFGLFFTLLAARDLVASRRRAALFVLLTLLTSNVAATYLIALGLSVLVTRRHVRGALAVIGAGLFWLMFTSLIGGGQGDALGGYAYLTNHAGAFAAAGPGLASVAVGALTHPGRVMHHLWAARWSLWGDVAASGPLGLLSPLFAGIPLVALLENGLNQGSLFIAPGNQNLPLYVMGPFGAALVVGALLSRRRAALRILGAAGAVVTLALSAGFAAIWYPRSAAQWLRVSPQAAAVLRRAERLVGPRAEVVVSQGVAGHFAQRRLVYPVEGPSPLPVRARVVDFVIAPDVGIETERVIDADRLLAQVTALPGARLVLAGAGVWVVRWTPQHEGVLPVPPAATALPAGVAVGPAGVLVAGGRSGGRLLVAGTSAAGYVLAGDYWRTDRTGVYRGLVSLRTTRTIDVELWDATADFLLGRRVVPTTNGSTDEISVEGTLTHLVGHSVYSGFGPWRVGMTSAPRGDDLELRVWSPGGPGVRVASVGLVRVGPRRPAG